MIRELFHVGSFSVSPFGVLMMLAFVAAFFELRSNLRFLDIGDEEDANVILFWGALAGLVGGKIYYAALHGDPALLIERYGFVWYGGFLLGAAAVLWTIRRRSLPLGGTADAAAPALALGYGVGRIGCFLVGDDYGVPTELPWGVAFPVGLPPTDARSLRAFGVEVPPDVPGDTLLSVHPTQLYESAAAILIFWIGHRLLRGDSRRGVTTMAVLVGLGIERFLVELVRAKDDRLLGPFTLAQAISLALVVVAATLWWRLARGADEAA